jgi:hypothetical protein
MPGPTDYVSPLLMASQGQQSPIQALGQGMALGDNIVDSQRQGLVFKQGQQDRTAAIEAAKQQAIAAAQKQVQVQEDTAKYIGENPTVSGIAKLVAAHPELEASYKTQREGLTKEREDQRLSLASTTFSLVQAGERMTAVDNLNRAALAHEKGEGEDSPEAAQLRSLAMLVDKDPKAAAEATGVFLARAMGPDQFEKTHGHLDTREAVIRKQEADAFAAEQDALTKTQQILAEIGYKDEQSKALIAKSKYDAGMLGLGWAELAQKNAADLAKFGTLPPAIGKEVSEDVAAANTSEAVADKMFGLAEDMKTARKDAGVVGTFINTGATGKLVEGANNMLVREGDFTDVRKRYKEIREKAVAAELKGQGSTTEAERSAFRDGWLDDGRDPAELARDLERRAKVLQSEAATRRGLSEYRSLNKSNGNAREEFTTSDGFTVTPGMSQATFAKEYSGFLKGKAAAQNPKPAAGKHADAAAALGGKPAR